MNTLKIFLKVGENDYLWGLSPCQYTENEQFKLFIRYLLEDNSCCSYNLLNVIVMTSPSACLQTYLTPILKTDTVFDNFIICTCATCRPLFPDTSHFGALLLVLMHSPKMWKELGLITVSVTLTFRGGHKARYMIHHRRKKIYLIAALPWYGYTHPVPIGYNNSIYNHFVSCKSREVPTLGNMCRHFCLINFNEDFCSKYLPAREISYMKAIHKDLLPFEVDAKPVSLFTSIEQVLHPRRQYLSKPDMCY